MYRVLIIVASLFVAFFNFGILPAYGALFSVTMDTFGEGRSKTSLVHSLMTGITFGIGVIGSYLIKRTSLGVVSAVGSILLPLGFIVSFFATSVTYLILTIGTVSGIGISLTYVSAVVVMSAVVPEKHKTTALSLQNVACGAPGIVIPYLYTWLSSEYGLAGTFLIYGGISLNNLAVFALFRGFKLKVSSNSQEDKETQAVSMAKIEDKEDKVEDCARGANQTSGASTDKVVSNVCEKRTNRSETSRRVMYLLFLIAGALVLSNIVGFQTIFQDIGVFKDLSIEQTLMCISAFNITGTFGRFLPVIFQKVSKNPLITTMVVSLAGVLGQVLILLTSQYSLILIGYALTGLTDGGTSASLSVVIFQILEEESQAMGFGFALTVTGFLATGSGPLFGAIYDITNSYSVVLSMTSSTFAFGFALFFGCFVIYQRTNEHVNPFPNDKNLYPSNLKAASDDKFKIDKNVF